MAPKKKAAPKSKARAKAAAAPAGDAAPARMEAPKGEDFNAVHFNKIRDMTTTILQHDVFTGVQSDKPLAISADASTSGREASRMSSIQISHENGSRLFKNTQMTTGMLEALNFLIIRYITLLFMFLVSVKRSAFQNLRPLFEDTHRRKYWLNLKHAKRHPA